MNPSRAVKISFLVFFYSLGFHVSLSTLNSTRPGPVGDPYTVSPSGSGRCSFQINAATIYTIASTGAMLLLSGRNAPENMRP